MSKIQHKRGLEADLEYLELLPGELAVALDTGNVYMGTNTGKVHINSVTSVCENTGDVMLAVNDIPQLPITKINDLGTAATKNTGTAAGNVPILDADGKLNSIVIPAIALSNIHIVGSQADIVNLTAQVGDVAIRTDENKTYILAATPASQLSNWEQILTPAAPVQSVNGRTGVVTVCETDENVKTTKVTQNDFLGTYSVPFTEASNTATGGLKIGQNLLSLSSAYGATLSVGSGYGVVDASEFTGTAATAQRATKLKTARTISLSGGVTGTATSFDGTSNITIPVTAVDPSALSTAVPIAKGGTGATTAAGVLSNLGITASAAELSYCQGLTANIQTQLYAIQNQNIDGGVF